MATQAIDSGDLSLIRSTSHTISDIGLWIVPLAVVQTLTITALPTTYPTISLTFSGTSTGVSVGQLVKIVNGDTVKAYAVIRKAVSGSTLYISETNLGASGYAARIENALEIGDSVIVYSARPLWNLNSRISNKIFYKYFDRAYVNENSQPPPVANTGEWQAVKLATGVTTASFILPRLGTNTSLAIGTTLSSRLWALPAGVTLQAGYALTDAVIGVDAEAGNHLVSYTVTDANSKTHTAYLWLFVSNGTTGASLDERYALEITGDSQDRKGRTLQVTITGDSSLADVLYAGAGVLFRTWYDYAGSELSEGVAVDSFIGYVADTIDMTHDGDIWTANITIQSPFLYASRIAQPPQSLEEKASPAKWTECTSSLSNPQGYLYYAIKWHCPTLLDMHDFDAPYTTPRRRYCQYNTNNLTAAMEVPAQFITGNVGSASNGATVMRRNPNYMSNTDRNALAIVLTFLTQDLRRKFDYAKRWGQEFADALTGAFATNGTTDKAWKAIKKWAQGVGRTELPDSVVTTTEGLERVKAIVGHYLAEQNADIQELTLFLNGFIDVIDPVYMLWIRFTVDSEFDPLGIGFTNERATATRVSRQWDRTKDDIYVTIDVTVKPETFGQPGEEYPIGSATTSTGVVTPVPYTPAVDSAFSGNGMALIIDDTGLMAITYNVLDASPNWIDLSTRFTGNINDADFDYNTAFFANGNITTEALGVYVVTTDSTDFNVYRLGNVLDAGNIPDLLETETMNDSSVTTAGRIKCSEATPTLVLAAWKDRTGTEFIRSTDGGATWSAKANVGSAITDTANDNAPLGMDIIGTVQVITAPDATPEYGLYKATTASGSFSEVTNTERSAIPMPMAKLAIDTVGYVSLPSTTPNDLYTYLITAHAGADSVGEAAVGNPDNGARMIDASHPSPDGLTVKPYLQIVITFAEPTDIDHISFQFWFQNTPNTGMDFIVLDDTGAEITDGGATGINGATENTWVTRDYDTDNAYYPGLPLSAQDSITFRVQWLDFLGMTRTDMEYRIDNITLNNGDIILDFDDNTGVDAGEPTVTYTLQQVSSITGSSGWTDVSPVADSAPIHPHDLVIDKVNIDVVHTAVYDGTNYDWYKTDDAANSWTLEESATDKRVPLTQGDGILFGGANGEVLLSLDNGVTFADATGNLIAVLPSFGNVKRILIL